MSKARREDSRGEERSSTGYPTSNFKKISGYNLIILVHVNNKLYSLPVL